MKKLISLFLVLVMILGLAACGSSGSTGSTESSAPAASSAPASTSSSAPASTAPAAEPAAAPSSINVAMGFQITTLDNGINTETGNDYILEHLYAGLFRLDESGAPQKELCKDYTLSDDGLTYTFTLKDDIMWSDGAPITAYDFEYSVLRGISYGAENAYSIKEILSYLKGGSEYNQAAVEKGTDFDCTVEDHSSVGIKALDEKTLEIQLKAPCAVLPSMLASRAWVAVPQDTPQHDSLWSLEPGYPTSGPYTLAECNPNEKAVLVKNPNYWNADAITMDEVTYWVMTDEDAQALAFENGDVDVALTVATTAADKYVGTDILNIIQEETSYFIAINSASTGPDYLKDVNVRRALALAIDKDAVSEVLGATYYPKLNGYVPHGVAGNNGQFRDEGDADGYTLNYDPETAKQLLAEAGYDASNPLTVTYKYSNNSIHGDVATMLESFWKNIGVNVQFDAVEYNVYYDQVDQGEFELCRYADSVVADPMRLLKLWTVEGQVVAAVADPEYDKMVDAALQLADPVEYINALHGLEDYLVEENVYLIPLFEYMLPTLTASYVDGVYMSGTHPFYGYCTISE